MTALDRSALVHALTHTPVVGAPDATRPLSGTEANDVADLVFHGTIREDRVLTPADPEFDRDVPFDQLHGEMLPYYGVLGTYGGVRVFPGIEVDAGDLAVLDDDGLRFYGPIDEDTGTRRLFATYERRAGAWWRKDLPR